MKIEIILFSLAFLATTFVFLLLRRAAGRQRLYLPDALVLAAAIQNIGALIVFSKIDSDGALFIVSAAYLAFVSVSAFTIGVLYCFNRGKSANQAQTYTPSKIYSFALLVTTVANSLVIFFILSNPAIAALVISVISGSNEATLLDVRKAITASTEGYMSPGVIKLVRDVISPIAIASFILSRDNAERRMLLWLAVLVIVAAMILGGQRFPMFLLMLSMVVAFAMRRVLEQRPLRWRVKWIVLWLSLVLLANVFVLNALGRTVAINGILDALLTSALSLLERIVLVPALEAERTFVYWSNAGPTFGLSWLRDLSMLLPGPARNSFSSTLHELSGGSAEGNAPLFFALDSWMAFGWVGIVIASGAFVLLLHMMDAILWRYKSPMRDGARVIMFLNTPMMYSPFLFLLYGGLIVLPICLFTLLSHCTGATRVKERGLQGADSGGGAASCAHVSKLGVGNS